MEGPGAKVERVLELAAITVNKNTVPGDKSALHPGGLRIGQPLTKLGRVACADKFSSFLSLFLSLGTPALTSRQMKEAEMVTIGQFIDEGVKIALDATAHLATIEKGQTLVVFKKHLDDNEEIHQKITKLREKVEAFASSYPIPGFDL